MQMTVLFEGTLPALALAILHQASGLAPAVVDLCAVAYLGGILRYLVVMTLSD